MTKDVHLLSGPLDFVAYGRDSTGYRWFVNGHEVVVDIPNTVMETDPAYLHPDTAEAILTRGENLVRKLLEWDVPASTITAYSNEVIYS